MSVFTAEWLGLREPYDGAARNRSVLEAVAAEFEGRYAVTVADLAAGTGSTFRAISPRLPAEQTWRLYDIDMGLLAGPSAPKHGARFQRITIDLNEDLEFALEAPLDLVTASALFDLTSGAWVERLVTEAAVRNLPVYAALTYDGRVTLSPSDPEDTNVISVVNHHQFRDKGFGAALGPGAAPFCIKRFRGVGYEVTSGRADWTFNTSDHEMQLQLLAGWAAAARTMGIVPRWRLQDWLARRRDLVLSSRSSMQIGHVDFFARPTTTR
jgi:hypothetical protein